MNVNERRKILIDALRSGKYELGRGHLRKILSPMNEDNDCVWCIGGAMCEEYRLLNEDTSFWKPFDVESDRTYMFYTESDDYDLESSRLVPSKAVLDFYGMSYQTLDRIVDLNDHLNEDGEMVINDLVEMAPILDSIFNEVGIEKGEWHEG